MFQKLSSHIVVYVSSFAVVTVLNIITLSFFARSLGPEKYGILGYLQGIFLLISAVISQGFIQSNVRFRSTYKEKDRYSEFVVYYLVTMVMVVGATVCLLYLAIPVLEAALPKVGVYKTAVMILVASSSLFLMLVSLFQANLQPKKSAMYSIGRALMRLIIPGSVLLLVNNDVEMFLYAISASEFVIIFFILFELMSGLNIKELKISKGDYNTFLKMFWSYGFPFVGWFLCSQIIIYSDRLILERYYSDIVVGTYVSNNSLAVFILSAVASPLMSAINPLIMSEVKDELVMTLTVEQAISTAVRVYLLLAGPLSLLAFIFRTDLSFLVFGKEYAAASDVFGPILLGVVVWNLSMYVHKPLEIAQKTKMMFGALFIASLFGISGNFILIPSQSYMGAAYSTMMGYIMYGVLITVLLRRSFIRIFPWRTAVRLIVTMATILVIDHMIHGVIYGWSPVQKVVLIILAATMIYGLMFVLGEFTIDEIKEGWKRFVFMFH